MGSLQQATSLALIDAHGKGHVGELQLTGVPLFNHRPSYFDQSVRFNRRPSYFDYSLSTVANLMTTGKEHHTPAAMTAGQIITFLEIIWIFSQVP
jgi:hypothetical protein